MLPAKADPEVQVEYLKNELEPRLEETKTGKRVFFVDAAQLLFSTCSVVGREGVEPSRTLVRRILSPLRLPIPPPSQLQS